MSLTIEHLFYYAASHGKQTHRKIRGPEDRRFQPQQSSHADLRGNACAAGGPVQERGQLLGKQALG